MLYIQDYHRPLKVRYSQSGEQGIDLGGASHHLPNNFVVCSSCWLSLTPHVTIPLPSTPSQMVVCAGVQKEFFRSVFLHLLCAETSMFRPIADESLYWINGASHSKAGEREREKGGAGRDQQTGGQAGRCMPSNNCLQHCVINQSFFSVPLLALPVVVLVLRPCLCCL